MTFCTGTRHFAINRAERVEHGVILVPENINYFAFPSKGITTLIGESSLLERGKYDIVGAKR